MKRRREITKGFPDPNIRVNLFSCELSETTPNVAVGEVRFHGLNPKSDGKYSATIKKSIGCTVFLPTLERANPRSYSSRAPCAFDLLLISSSCDSHSFSHFASVFLDRRA